MPKSSRDGRRSQGGGGGKKVTAPTEWHIETGDELRRLIRDTRALQRRITAMYGVSSPQSERCNAIERAIFRVKDRLDSVACDEHPDTWSARWYFGPDTWPALWYSSGSDGSDE